MKSKIIEGCIGLLLAVTILISLLMKDKSESLTIANNNQKTTTTNLSMSPDGGKEYYKQAHIMTKEEFALNQVGNVGDELKYYDEKDGYYNTISVTDVELTKKITDQEEDYLKHAQENPLKNVIIANNEVTEGTFIKVSFTIKQSGGEKYLSRSGFVLAGMDENYKENDVCMNYKYGFPMLNSSGMTFYQRAGQSGKIYYKTDNITETIRIDEGKIQLQWAFYCPDEIWNSNTLYFCIKPDDNRSNGGVRVKIYDKK